MELTQEIVRELLDYDPETGDTFWKKRDVKWFSDGKSKTAQHKMNSINKKIVGKRAGHLDKITGYYRIFILGKLYQLHRVIWLYMTGEWPDQIDHKNGTRSDNRWCNFKNVSALQNHKNRGFMATNTSGFRGVSWSKKNKKWLAYIKIGGKSLYIGSFDNPEEAFLAYAEEARKNNFTERHIFG